MYGQTLIQISDSIMSKVYEENGPGGIALVAKGEEILYRKAFGLADLELGVKMTPENIIRIGSLTKQFTAIAILKLAEEGKLGLQDPITKYIDDYPTLGYRITIEHLLTHTSGIRSFTNMNAWNADLNKMNIPPQKKIDFFKDEPMDFVPGEEFKYNNSGYILLGYIIELVSGKTYKEYIEESLFKPLGMYNSFYESTSNIIKNRARGYKFDRNEYKNADFLDMSNPYAAGSLISTVDDLFTWYNALMQYKVISKASLEKAHSPYKLNNGKPTEYGYGWFVSNLKGHQIISHGGGITGYLTYSLYIPDEDIFVAVFSNCTCKSPSKIGIELAKIALNN